MKNMVLERYLIIKMAKILEKWKEPYDKEDYLTQEANFILENEYDILKKILCDIWDNKLDIK